MSRWTRTRWEQAAQTEPYYSVLARPEFLMTNVAASRAAFFDSGDRDADGLLHFLRALAPNVVLHRVLEFGCGPGRMLVPFARRGFDVTGVDHSSAMLELARTNLQSFDISNVTLLDADAFASRDEQFDLVNVTQVLQHLDRDEALATLRMLANRLTPGGFLHLTFPFRTERSRASQMVLGAREALPPLNAAINRMRKRPSHAPLFRPHVHSIDAIFALGQDAHCDVVRTQIVQESELTTANVVLRKRATPLSVATETPAANYAQEHVEASEYLDPRELIASVGLEGLHARAEAYFASSQEWDQQLAKPFGSITDAPAMLVGLGILLHGAELRPGMTVVDFGGGTGWLSRFLLQLGCNAILVDVAPSALRIANEFITSHPPMGKIAGEFRTALFDGTHLPIGDEEVDRIICFDAFHHVPNIDATLAEFARILKPGGTVVFSEPGPDHSRSPQSQYEMRVYGVLENDFDMHAIWRTARTLGFDDIRLAPFNAAPSFISMLEFEDLLAKGPSLQRAANEMRDYIANMRSMILRKHGQERLDSRTAKGLAASIEITFTAEAIEDQPIPYTATITNVSKQEWLSSLTEIGGVYLGAHLYTSDGALVDFHLPWQRVSESSVAPNQQVTITAELPPLRAGEYVVEFDCVANRISWFMQAGSKATRTHLTVRARH